MSWLYQPLLPAAAFTPSTLYWVGGAGTWDQTTSTNWAATSGGTGGAGVPTAETAVIFDNNSGTGVVVISNGTCGDLTLTASVPAIALQLNADLTVYGNLSILGTGASIANVGTFRFAATSSKTITTSGEIFNCPVAFDGVGGTWVLQDNMTVAASYTTTLTNGTLNLNGKSYSTGVFTSSNSNTRSITSSTTATIFITTAATDTVWTTGNPANFTISNNVTVDITGNSSATKTISAGGGGEAFVNFKIGGNGTTFNIGGAFPGGYCKSLTITNTTCTINNLYLNIYGNLDVQGTSPTFVAGTNIWYFRGAGTQTITTNGKSLSFPITFDATGTTFQLVDNLTVVNENVVLTSGTLDINSKTLTAYAFQSSNTNTRTVAFGTGKIVTVNGNLLLSNSTNLTITGTPIFECTMSPGGGTLVVVVGSEAAGYWTESTALSVSVGSSTGAAGIYLTFGTSSSVSLTGIFKDYNLTGFTGTISSSAQTIYGNYTIPSTVSWFPSGGTNPTLTFASTSGTKTIDTNHSGVGRNINRDIVFNGVGGTWRLLSNLILQGTTTLTNGTLDLNGLTYDSNEQFITATGTKNITFNGGTLKVSTLFNNAQPTGFTTTAGTGTGKISMNLSSGKTFTGGGSTYNCTLENAGAGALTISGNNTFTTISNSVQPTTFTFTSGSTQTVTNFNVSGTSGNLVTINSTSAGSPATLSKASGTVSVSFCSIKDSTATGGATWQAYTSNGNVDNTGNSGWVFIVATAGYVKIYMGSGPGWVYKPVKVWNGTQWVIKPAKWYNSANTSWDITKGL